MKIQPKFSLTVNKMEKSIGGSFLEVIIIETRHKKTNTQIIDIIPTYSLKRLTFSSCKANQLVVQFLTKRLDHRQHNTSQSPSRGFMLGLW